MKSIQLTSLILAVTVALGGCASSGKPTTGSQAGDYGVLGAIAGAAAGYVGAKAVGGSGVAARNAAVLGATAGGVMGYQHGKVLDQRQAEAANAAARASADAIQRDLAMRANIRYVDMPVAPAPTQAVPQPQPVVKPVAQALELPIARLEMVSTKGGLTPKAVKTLGYMSRQANQANADLVVLIPSADTGFASAIQGAAPGARLMESREAKDFMLIVQPKA